MPRVRADAPDLAISLDGAWLARLDAGQLSLYDLRDSAPEALEEPVVTLEQAGSTGPGYVTFCHGDRLLCLLPFRVDEEGTDEGLVATLLEVPTLEPMSRLVVPGARRVLGIGPTGAVVAPLAAGADVISIRGADLSLDQTFLRGDVLSAVPAPERRWLIEQRGGHELWDVATRRITAHLTLATRLPLLQVGFAQGGKLIWTLAAAVPVHLEVFRFSDGRRLFELDEPGRPLRAEAGPGRLVVAHSTESGSARFLDVDLGEQTLRRLEAPAGSLLSFALRPGLCAELLALVEEGGGRVCIACRCPRWLVQPRRCRLQKPHVPVRCPLFSPAAAWSLNLLATDSGGRRHGPWMPLRTRGACLAGPLCAMPLGRKAARRLCRVAPSLRPQRSQPSGTQGWQQNQTCRSHRRSHRRACRVWALPDRCAVQAMPPRGLGYGIGSWPAGPNGCCRRRRESCCRLPRLAAPSRRWARA
ncbi:MAG: hypothetical protein NZ890_13190 [Myxococcota bacterium]|nr:hypothetical protein [Myxococcota bacterium]